MQWLSCLFLVDKLKKNYFSTLVKQRRWIEFFLNEKNFLSLKNMFYRYFFSCFTNVWRSPKGEYLSLFSLWHLPSSLNLIFSIIDKNNHDKKVAFSPLKEEENHQCSFISQSGQKKSTFKSSESIFFRITAEKDLTPTQTEFLWTGTTYRSKRFISPQQWNYTIW